MDRDYTYRIIGCVYEVYNQLGPGLLESIYEAAMIKELQANGFEVKNQVQVPVYYKGELICPDLRLDLIIDDKVILELKSVVEYRTIFEKQLSLFLFIFIPQTFDTFVKSRFHWTNKKMTAQNIIYREIVFNI